MKPGSPQRRAPRRPLAGVDAGAHRERDLAGRRCEADLGDRGSGRERRGIRERRVEHQRSTRAGSSSRAVQAGDARVEIDRLARDRARLDGGCAKSASGTRRTSQRERSELLLVMPAASSIERGASRPPPQPRGGGSRPAPLSSRRRDRAARPRRRAHRRAARDRRRGSRPRGEDAAPRRLHRRRQRTRAAHGGGEQHRGRPRARRDRGSGLRSRARDRGPRSASPPSPRRTATSQLRCRARSPRSAPAPGATRDLPARRVDRRPARRTRSARRGPAIHRAQRGAAKATAPRRRNAPRSKSTRSGAAARQRSVTRKSQRAPVVGDQRRERRRGQRERGDHREPGAEHERRRARERRGRQSASRGEEQDRDRGDRRPQPTTDTTSRVVGASSSPLRARICAPITSARSATAATRARLACAPTGCAARGLGRQPRSRGSPRAARRRRRRDPACPAGPTESRRAER